MGRGPGLSLGDTRERRRWWRAPWLLLLLFGATICNCNNDSQIANLDDFLGRAAHAYCAWQFRCCLSLSVAGDVQPYTTEEDCVPYIRLVLADRLATEKASVDAHRASLDTVGAATCLRELDKRACITTWPGTTGISGVGTAACRRLLVGRVPLGGSCLGSDECKGSRCSGRVARSSNVTGDDLAAVFGDPVETVGACVGYQSAGEVCVVHQDCDPRQGLYCRGTDFRCAPLGQEGDHCANPVSTSTATDAPAPGLEACDTDALLFCDGRLQRCRRLARDGEPCLSELGAPLQCDPDPSLMLSCVGVGFNGSGICKRAAQVGDVCGGSGIPPCAPQLTCALEPSGLGQCVGPPDIGEPCDPNGRCLAPYVCDFSNHTCATPGKLPPGAACSENADCSSLACYGPNPTDPNKICTSPLVDPSATCSVGFTGNGSPSPP